MSKYDNMTERELVSHYLYIDITDLNVTNGLATDFGGKYIELTKEEKEEYCNFLNKLRERVKEKGLIETRELRVGNTVLSTEKYFR